MERDLDNANPTILNVSQLPSRRRKGVAARHGPDSKCDTIVYPKHHWPYGSSSSSDEDEDYGEELVDEQDIYGTFRRHLNLSPAPCQRWVREPRHVGDVSLGLAKGFRCSTHHMQT
jgi:hypothetical protein